ncbi:MAG: type III secretion system stator protein SctL [Hydrogenophaga sp.]|uniref:type III secretion system stator protein SctL n=1 Tax=Hydrogenophaga sp. TaxID=1904254 RepID=UPI00262EEC25|nr:type III secretion system stator protein SctL [Hydrogenophaga sp.]MCW5671876.1 type III secretion system stator protein SctL [Hydrogenophaga sp.]
MRSGKIIRREEANLFRQAAQVLADAQAEAASLLDHARRQAEEEAGRIRRDSAQAAAQETSRLMLQAIASRDAYMTEVESELVSVVINAVRSIFAQYNDHERAVLAVGKALKALRQQTQATLHVHPSHHDALCAAVPALLRDTPGLQSLVVERDSRLKPGTFVLRSAMGLVETDLESQLRAIENALVRSVKASDAARHMVAGVPI